MKLLFNQIIVNQNTLRGLHYQKLNQGKLVRCIYGEVLDVAVDIRKDSPSFCKWASIKINSENKKQVYVPQDLHMGLVLSDYAEIIYQCTELLILKNDKGIIWNDSSINIEWGIKTPIYQKRFKAFTAKFNEKILITGGDGQLSKQLFLELIILKLYLFLKKT